MTMNSNAPSPRPHVTCGKCREKRQIFGSADPKVWACGDKHLESAQADATPPARTFVDGGNPGDRDRIAAASPPPTNEADDVRLDCRAGCGARVMLAPSTAADPTQIRAYLVAHGWSAGGFCSSTCVANAPRPVAAAPLAVAPINDISYQRSRALARRNAGLPELPEHVGLLNPPAPAATPAKPARVRQ